jgi:hypothetical protein
VTAKRFYTRPDLIRERRNTQAQRRVVLEALALYQGDPRPYTELTVRRIDGLEEILRVHAGPAAELRSAHTRPRPRVRGRARCRRD